MAVEVKGPRRPLSTSQVALHTAPTANRRKAKKHGDPTAELSYAEGVEIVKKFLQYSSTHTVAELQAFTATKVPTPRWVIKQTVKVSSQAIDKAAKILWQQLSIDEKSAKLVGGSGWWTLRGRDLTAEWIEMKNQRATRLASLKQDDRVLLYFHGGGGFFSSLETHRYQIQRHARKLNGRAFAPNIRLAPQYPFPCALHDALASYLYLISPDGCNLKPSQIIVSGDSAGGGLALSLLIVLRDAKLPLPAGSTLISPWVDLAHSFPSISGDDSGDYLPSNGFHFKPGLEWPPLPSEKPFKVKLINSIESSQSDSEDTINDNVVELQEQMQMYCSNELLNHPLVSPVNQGVLSGLPPIYIAAGSSELLRDEIIYLAHKISNPDEYPPSSKTLQDYPSQQRLLDLHKTDRHSFHPTRIQLQLFDGGCHVATTLSITSLAKFQYRGAANFALWALTAAKKRDLRIKSEKKHHQNQTSSSKSGSESESNLSNNSNLKTFSNLKMTEKNAEHNSSMTSASPNSSQTSSLILPKSLPKINSTDFNQANEEDHSENYQSEIEDSSQDDSSSAEQEDQVSSTSIADTDTSLGNQVTEKSSNLIKVTGQLPSFGLKRFLRQRVNVKGQIYNLEPEDELQACQMNPQHVGQLHTKPVNKWFQTRQQFDIKYKKELNDFREIKRKDYMLSKEMGYLNGMFKGEDVPLCAVACWSSSETAMLVAKSVDVKPKEKSLALMSWAKVSSKPDQDIVGNRSESVDEVEKKMQEL
ncbi:hypothetical protein OIO90_006060 [Microbotryomycetes sp. JL221]|nr:hypothetical protein OIO90_006060 [Microbotryomycetes sp. JL221]